MTAHFTRRSCTDWMSWRVGQETTCTQKHSFCVNQLESKMEEKDAYERVVSLVTNTTHQSDSNSSSEWKCSCPNKVMLFGTFFFPFIISRSRVKRTICISCAQINDLFKFFYLTHNLELATRGDGNDDFFSYAIPLSLSFVVTQAHKLTEICISNMMNVGEMIHATLLMLH